jgi:hypothetical protein
MGWLMGVSVHTAITGHLPKRQEPKPKLTPKALWRAWEKRPKAVDLFSGGGGGSLGVREGGWNVIGHVENDGVANVTYALNEETGGPFDELIGDDITMISDYDIKDFARRRGPIGLLFGSPPCQGFSMSGKRDPKDPRNSLFQHSETEAPVRKRPTALAAPGLPAAAASSS